MVGEILEKEAALLCPNHIHLHWHETRWYTTPTPHITHSDNTRTQHACDGGKRFFSEPVKTLVTRRSMTRVITSWCFDGSQRENQLWCTLVTHAGTTQRHRL